MRGLHKQFNNSLNYSALYFVLVFGLRDEVSNTVVMRVCMFHTDYIIIPFELVNLKVDLSLSIDIFFFFTSARQRYTEFCTQVYRQKWQKPQPLGFHNFSLCIYNVWLNMMLSGRSMGLQRLII